MTHFKYSPKYARAQRGFSLLEIMVVLVILGLLVGIVAPNVLQNVGKAEQQKVKTDFKAIETALKTYRLDNYSYPTTEQGLEALVSRSNLSPEPRNFQKGGYLPTVPKDPWGRPYVYFSPGEHGEFDIYTLGADGVQGGDDNNKDVGNWEEDDR